MLDFLARSESHAWHQQLARLLRTAATPDFPARLDQSLRELVGHETVLINAYRGRRQPLLIHDDYPPHRHEQGVERYLSQAYLLDPFFAAVSNGLDQGAHRLRELAPDRFEASEYYAHYYRALGLVDEVGIFCRVEAEVVIAVSLGFGTKSPPLTRRALQALRYVSPIAEALLTEYWKWQGSQFQQRLAEQEPVEAALASFGAAVLTAREQEIVRLLLAGHSTKSAARELDISDGTVKVHRKHIYQRLEVSSQSQLFRLFLDHVALVSRQQAV
ncbi:response regulator transcription factor [Halomonas sp. MCCC 1A17488]|jgi:DNA-binding CsgD family transcriptional regulator|uniref:Response regulator transcription factor n=2 Tax=Billgrantia TaxID=3137761 RepID=A0A6I6SUD5_9GAMM|nr:MULTISPECIES: LuxR C-terminal-related transcriptional regulator [Halomonas]MCE8014589.1 response regulator transcription factor [Halomonas sp. MCCC 1A17488]MCE8034825.1 response regulator transcription factor [Halomonas sp. MCCC 1A11057]MCG3237922.1 response regulator transcription factor [Halomonas sp. MCCC 1A17488]QHC50653.1 response regulator transcription factor [Halomonas tianxiuensis]QPP48293.1 response regulator transcription factor [Halomonas sp. SS10-MC5]